MNHYMLRMTIKSLVNNIPFAADNDNIATKSAIDCVVNYVNNGFEVSQFVVDHMDIGVIENGEPQTCYPWRVFSSGSDSSDLNVVEDDELSEEHRLLVQKIRTLYCGN